MFLSQLFSRTHVYLLLFLGVAFLSACSSPHSPGEDAARKESSGTSALPISVVVTIAPLADWVKNVGGDDVRVTTLVPPGTSPHTFEPSPADAKTIADAQMFVGVGLQLDEWALRLPSSSSRIRVLMLGDILARKKLLSVVDEDTTAIIAETEHPADHDSHEHEHEHGINPHFWLDPVLAQAAVDEIVAALSETAPQEKDKWTSHGNAYKKKLAELDAEIRHTLEPCQGAQLVTFHNAFAYFAKRYNLKVAGVIEEYAGKQPSEQYLKNLVNKLRSLGIKTIFAEPQLSPRVAELLANELGARVEVLDPEGTSNRSSYDALMRYNAQTIRQSLCP